MLPLLRNSQIAFPLKSLVLTANKGRATSHLVRKIRICSLPVLNQIRFKHDGQGCDALSFQRKNRQLTTHEIKAGSLPVDKNTDFIRASNLPGAILCCRSLPGDPLFYIYQNDKIIAKSDKLPEVLEKEPIYLRSKTGDFVRWP